MNRILETVKGYKTKRALNDMNDKQIMKIFGPAPMKDCRKRAQKLFAAKETFQVEILKNGTHVDTQTVSAMDKWHAKTIAMMQTKVPFSGEFATYVVTKK